MQLKKKNTKIVEVGLLASWLRRCYPKNSYKLGKERLAPVQFQVA